MPVQRTLLVFQTLGYVWQRMTRTAAVTYICTPVHLCTAATCRSVDHKQLTQHKDLVPYTNSPNSTTHVTYISCVLRHGPPNYNTAQYRT